MSIYVSTLSRFDVQQPTKMALAEIISTISSGTHSDICAEIGQTSDKAQQSNLKLELPMFFPTVVFEGENRLSDSSEPTGLVQFDIDQQDNPDADLGQTMQQVCSVAEVIYAFRSPSGGLKFALKTDLHKNADETIDETKYRFRLAYEHCEQYMSQHIDVVADSSASHLKQACYLSHDPDAYHNPNCETLLLNDACVWKEPALSKDAVCGTTPELIQELLQYIPRDLRFHDRLRVNCAVFASLGHNGIDVLYAHWSKPDRQKLRQQLEQQEKSWRFGHVGDLVNIAKEHGYKPPEGRARRNLKAKPTSHVFPPAADPQEAREQVASLVKEFVSSRNNTFINVSTGLGKTQAALEVINALPVTKKILYLVADHNLGAEIYSKLGAVKPEQADLKSQMQRAWPIHMKGRTYRDADDNPMCENHIVLKEYEDAGISMPLGQCLIDCPHLHGCRYIQQFNGHHNLRIMTHRELSSNSSSWFAGVTNDAEGNVTPRNTYWEPDYIIVDENFIDIELNTEELVNEYGSLRNVINELLNGMSMVDAVRKHQPEIVADHAKMKKGTNRGVDFHNRAQYITATKNLRARESVALKVMAKYIFGGLDPTVLDGITFNKDRKCINAPKRTRIARRYWGTPTLFLDATADERVVRRCYPGIDFHSVMVASSPDIQVHQLENYNWTKKRLSSAEDRRKLVKTLEPYTKQYSNVGLITYKNVLDLRDFDQWLAGELGIPLYGHFGLVRGVDKFKDVDCLLIVGRHLLPPNTLKDFSTAVFGPSRNGHTQYVDLPVRMKDGSAQALSNLVFQDDRLECIKRHFCQAETIQAIGRARLVHGKSKDVFVFCNESFGGDIEITDFFRYKEAKYTDLVVKIQRIGYCADMPKDLQNLGVTANAAKMDRERIRRELGENGIDWMEVEFRNSARQEKTKKYLVADVEKLKRSLADDGNLVRSVKLL